MILEKLVIILSYQYLDYLDTFRFSRFHPQTVNIHSTSIHEYFQNFGRVEWVARPFAGETGTFFICFQSFESAFDVLVMEDHDINGYEIHLYHDWYFSEMKYRGYLREILIGADTRLNDDCILMTMRHLDLVDLLHVARFNHRFGCLARQRHNVEITPSVMKQPIGLMTLKHVLAILKDTLTKLEISIGSIHTEVFGNHSYFLKSAVIHCIQSHIGPNVKIVSLRGFGLEETEPLIQFLYSELCPRGVDVILS